MHSPGAARSAPRPSFSTVARSVPLPGSSSVAVVTSVCPSGAIDRYRRDWVRSRVSAGAVLPGRVRNRPESTPPLKEVKRIVCPSGDQMASCPSRVNAGLESSADREKAPKRLVHRPSKIDT